MFRFVYILFFLITLQVSAGLALAQQDLPLPGRTLKNTATITPPVKAESTGTERVSGEITEHVGQALEESSPAAVQAVNDPIEAKHVEMPDSSALKNAQQEPKDRNLTPAQAQFSVDAAPPVPENIFYDSQSLVPQTEMGRGVPRKLDPRAELASKYIVVKKNRRGGSVDARLVAADRALKLGRYDSALSIYDELHTKRPKDVNVLFGRAIAYQHLGRNEEAMHAYEDVLSINPNMVDAEVNMLGLMSKNFPSVALERLLTLWEHNSDNVAIAAQIAVVQGQLGRYDEAVRYLGIASGLDPENANHVYNMAVISDRVGAKKDAIKYYEKALEIDSIYGGGRTIPREPVFERLSSLR
jgi:tetratricopeptide (TPR) repeat protein